MVINLIDAVGTCVGDPAKNYIFFILIANISGIKFKGSFMLNFNYVNYVHLIELIKKKGFEFKVFGEPFSSKCVLLRHDVDFSLDFSLRMAEIENKLGVNSTYFVQLGSPFYNIFDKHNKKIIQQIINLGHSIGLHFDITNHKINDYKDFELALNFELDVMSEILNQKVLHFSFHRPASNSFDHDDLNEDSRYVHSKCFDQFKYISDSRMQFREDLISYLDNHSFDAYQLNFHPIWYSDSNSSLKQRLETFSSFNQKQIKSFIEDNIRDFTFEKNED